VVLWPLLDGEWSNYSPLKVFYMPFEPRLGRTKNKGIHDQNKRIKKETETNKRLNTWDDIEEECLKIIKRKQIVLTRLYNQLSELKDQRILCSFVSVCTCKCFYYFFEF
jgi:hypothetical protein